MRCAQVNVTGASCAAAASLAHVSIRNISKRFGQFEALRDVSLDIRTGEFVCFLGPSGCGKTTLLRAIAGLDLQNAGSVHIGGRDVSLLPAADRDFGIVFQSYALFPNLTVSANVGYGLVNRGLPRRAVEARVTELLTTVGLADQARKYPVQLSGGQQQRVALARALATSPSLLLLDEPLSALDARVRVRLRDELKWLQRHLGLTTIMVTHDQDEAMGLADRIVVMDKGRIEQVGTPAEVYGQPATPFVADFIGTMNFLAAQATGGAGLRIGDLDILAAHPLVTRPGEALSIAIRPEELRVATMPTANGAMAAVNAFHANVAGVGFHGGFYRLRLVPAAAPREQIVADVPVHDLREMVFAPGQAVLVAMPPEHIHVFAA
jgi:iron(III) transport system ATP-binding protein